MRQVYMSFLGLGQYNPTKEIYEYLPAQYILNGKYSQSTEFVQVAELEMLGTENFDQIYILGTQKSLAYHFENLKAQMQALNASPVQVKVTEDLDAQGQWQLFERILECIEIHDQLTLDLTHGFRSMPIVVSAAINFLQKSRNINLDAVYYGAFDKDRDATPIVNMKDFYVINEWADGVSRLVEDADAKKLIEVAEKALDFQTGGLNDDQIIHRIKKLTNTLRNIDVNRVGDHAYEALRCINNQKAYSTETGRILLDLVTDKYTSLVSENPYNNRYDKEYFWIQLQIINLLLEHNLFMQAYTVMREYIASLAMIPFEIEGMNHKKRKKRRHKYAEIFVRMLQYDDDEWSFSDKQQQYVDRLKPFYDQLKSLGIAQEIGVLIKKLVDYRNGFDHAWTVKSSVPEDLESMGETIAHSLQRVYQELGANNLMP